VLQGMPDPPASSRSRASAQTHPLPTLPPNPTQPNPTPTPTPTPTPAQPNPSPTHPPTSRRCLASLSASAGGRAALGREGGNPTQPQPQPNPTPTHPTPFRRCLCEVRGEAASHVRHAAGCHRCPVWATLAFCPLGAKRRLRRGRQPWERAQGTIRHSNLAAVFRFLQVRPWGVWEGAGALVGY